jgi:hypothetical protein
VEENTTITGVVLALGLRSVPGNCGTIKKYISRLGLSTEHFTGCAHGTSGAKIRLSLESILTKNSFYNGPPLRKRLITEGLLPEVCSICGLDPMWQKRRLVLQLDHINGDRSDNRLENLRLLCPNCHSQTPTWAGRNRSVSKRPPKTCCDCGREVHRTSKRCQPCWGKTRRKKRS